MWVHSLHEKYGPVVRISPDQVFVSDPRDAHQIHRIKGEYLKAPFYEKIVPGIVNVFNATSVDAHRRYRKLLSGPISETGLQVLLPQVDTKVRLAVHRISEEMYTRGAADISKWWMFMTTDVIGELSFGESFRMLEYGEYIHDLESVGKSLALRVAFPILRYISPYLPLPIISHAFAAQRRSETYAKQSLQRHRDLVENDPDNVKPTLFSTMYKAGDKETLTMGEILNNARSYIIAGSDTTSNTLTYLIWSVCRDPDIKKQLLEELNMLSEDFTDRDLKALPYMNRVIDETLRLYSAAPGGLPRSVPEGGATFGKHWLPGGTVVLTQAYSLHRNEEAFPDAEKFDPSRWENPTQAMKEAYMPFGGGSRVCIGMHLAYMELRLATARFFRTFPNATMSSVEGMSDKDMEQGLYFLMSPRGGRCLIQAS
ncbi:putative cytochrome p450 protein [Eutypa lata UCREL1]|uniref:Putative cytochrome p450 protein n=1 Tax=Eutypa lata (strain UCR-EL1) TaxID=1287681 RepID=M7T8E2_EUTLA|nr:putative cytochrome p450 protein [Eutypa lata UCREL1]